MLNVLSFNFDMDTSDFYSRSISQLNIFIFVMMILVI